MLYWIILNLKLDILKIDILNLFLADIYSKPVASPADGSSKNNKPLSSWGRGNTTPNPNVKPTGKVDQIQRTASFEQFQKLAKEKEEKVLFSNIIYYLD